MLLKVNGYNIVQVQVGLQFGYLTGSELAAPSQSDESEVSNSACITFDPPRNKDTKTNRGLHESSITPVNAKLMSSELERYISDNSLRVGPFTSVFRFSSGSNERNITAVRACGSKHH
jgi:hypothetical protein